MSLFPNNPNPAPPTGAAVSSAASEASLGFWQRNRKGVLLMGGCLVLLLASRAYTGRAREAKKVAKADKLTQADSRDEMDKNSAIAGLQARFTAEREKHEAQEQQDLAAQMAAHQLTAAQLEALAAGGVGTSGMPAAAVAAGSSPVVGSPRPAYYNSAETGTSPVPEKPVTLVISYRGQEADPATSPAAVAAPAAVVAPAAGYLLPGMEAPTAAVAAAAPKKGTGIEKSKANPEDAEHVLATSSGEKFRVREGTWIPCTEELRINGSFASDIDCLVSIPIYGVSGSTLLIPQGTLALGHVAAVGSQNQQRLFVVFDRLIMPDGYTLTYDNAAGLDQIGQTGLRDQVTHHYLQMFGASVAIAAVGGLAQIGNFGNSAVTSPGSQYRSGVTQGMAEGSVQILNRFSSVLPTFIIREGARNNIHLPFNLWLPDYAKHHMGGDL